MKHSARVIAVSERPDSIGPLFDGVLVVEMDPDRETLAMAVIRQLRGDGVKLRRGDRLFFPAAAPRHRDVVVK